MLKRISYNIILIILIWIIPFRFVLRAQVIPDTISVSSSQPPFANDPNYNRILKDAMILQNIADSLGKLAFQYRQDIMFMDNVYERNRLQYQLGILEDQMRSVQAEADSLFDVLPQFIWPVDRTSLLILDTIIEGIKVYHYNTEELNVNSNQLNISGGDVQKFTEENQPIASEPINSFSISSRPAYSSDHPFENNFQIPPGVFYRIQMAVYTQEVRWEQFGGIQPITVEKTGEEEVIKYFAGKFSKYSDAASAMSRVRSSGFKDAFIVSYYNAHRMSVEQVREYERAVH